MTISGASKLQDKYGSDRYSKMLSEPINKAVNKSINADVPRTFPDNIYFRQDSKNYSSLSRILCAFAAHNPHVGYCQVNKSHFRIKLYIFSVDIMYFTLGVLFKYLYRLRVGKTTVSKSYLKKKN